MPVLWGWNKFSNTLALRGWFVIYCCHTGDRKEGQHMAPTWCLSFLEVSNCFLWKFYDCYMLLRWLCNVWFQGDWPLHRSWIMLPCPPTPTYCNSWKVLWKQLTPTRIITSGITTQTPHRSPPSPQKFFSIASLQHVVHKTCVLQWLTPHYLDE